METQTTQQEILLITGTTFSSRQWCEKDGSNPNPLSEKEQLQVACWNGLLAETLPEIFSMTDSTKILYLWQIREGSSFLHLELGEVPMEKENHLSIDPYAFLAGQLYS